MHLTEAASHCVSGLNSLCEAECIFRCVCTQNWNQIIFVISWKWKRCHLIWLRLNQRLLHKTLCNYLGSRNWREKLVYSERSRLLCLLVTWNSTRFSVFGGRLLDWSRCARVCSSLCLRNKYGLFPAEAAPAWGWRPSQAPRCRTDFKAEATTCWSEAKSSSSWCLYFEKFLLPLEQHGISELFTSLSGSFSSVLGSCQLR